MNVRWNYIPAMACVACALFFTSCEQPVTDDEARMLTNRMWWTARKSCSTCAMLRWFLGTVMGMRLVM